MPEGTAVRDSGREQGVKEWCDFRTLQTKVLTPEPRLRIGLDRLHHQVQVAEASLPDPHDAPEGRVDFGKGGCAVALLIVEGAEHVFRGERVQLIVAYDVRHCSISNRLRRSDALSRFAGMSSLTASSSRVNAP